MDEYRWIDSVLYKVNSIKPHITTETYRLDGLHEAVDDVLS